MATQLAVPAPVYIPQGEVMAPEPESVKEYHFELTEAARNFRRCVAQIAYYGFRMRLSEGWTALGFESGPRGGIVGLSAADGEQSFQRRGAGVEIDVAGKDRSWPRRNAVGI